MLSFLPMTAFSGNAGIAYAAATEKELSPSASVVSYAQRYTWKFNDMV